MSEPKRYNEEMVNISNGDPCGEIEFDYSASMVEAFEGRWVAWEDYAELKAEAERYRLASLRVDVSELHAQFNRALFDDTIAENARLKAEVERLSKPAIIGGYNLSQYIRMANSETLEFDNGDIFADMTLPERIKYIVGSHAALKEEVERLKEGNECLDQMHEKEMARSAFLCEQVERLTKAGDAMLSEWANGEEKDAKNFLKALVIWNAAKDGKQS